MGVVAPGEKKNIINYMYIQWLGEIFPPSNENTVGVSNEITLLIFYYASSRLVTLLKVIDASIKPPNIFYLTVSLKLLKFSFQICLVFALKMCASFTFTLFKLSTLLWLGYCTHCI